MRRMRLVILALCLAAAASRARAEGLIELHWNDCAAGYAVTNAVFSCAANTGSHSFYVSFVAPAGVTALASITARLQISPPMLPVGAARALANYPAWWELVNAGACRASALNMAESYGACETAWGGTATARIDGFTTGGGSLVRVLDVSLAPADGTPTALTLGDEYVVMRLQLGHQNTTGPGACAGCAEPMWVILTQVVLHMADGAPDVVLTQPGTCSYLTWQGAPPPIPTRNRTWGAIKSMYR